MLADAAAFLKAWQGPLTLAAVFFGPSLVRRTITLIRPSSKLKSPPASGLAKLIVLLHLLYAAYSLIQPPYDIFTTHSKPITTPTNQLRPLIARSADLPPPTGDTVGNPLIDLLLVRLANLPARLQYARWGHTVFLNCAWCTSQADYALAALPSILGPYAIEAAVIGALGWSWVTGPGAHIRTERFRGAVGWSLVFLAGAEYAARAYWEVWVSKGDCLHLSPLLFKIRTVALFLLTAGYVLFPVRPTQKDEMDHELLRVLDETYTTLNLASNARAAISQSKGLARLDAEHKAERLRMVHIAKAAARARGENDDPEDYENARRLVRSKWESIVQHRQ